MNETITVNAKEMKQLTDLIMQNYRATMEMSNQMEMLVCAVSELEIAVKGLKEAVDSIK
jgi:hypothetical protein